MTQYTTQPVTAVEHVERDLLDLLDHIDRIERTIGQLPDYGTQFDLLTWLASSRTGAAEALATLAASGGPR